MDDFGTVLANDCPETLDWTASQFADEIERVRLGPTKWLAKLRAEAGPRPRRHETGELVDPDDSVDEGSSPSGWRAPR